MAIFSTILAIAKAIPVLDSWLSQFMAFYTQQKIASMKDEDYQAVRKAVLERDQRDLEKAAGNPNPGEVSNAPGSEIISGPPPGVGQ